MKSRFVVVGAEIGGAGMRDLDGNQRNVGFAVLGRDNRRDVFVGLELDDEIHLLADQDIGVPLRDLARCSGCRRRSARCPRPAPRAAGPSKSPSRTDSRSLGGVAEAVELLLERPQAGAIEVLADLLDHAAPFERVEQAEHHALRQPAAEEISRSGSASPDARNADSSRDACTTDLTR